MKRILRLQHETMSGSFTKRIMLNAVGTPRVLQLVNLIYVYLVQHVRCLSVAMLEGNLLPKPLFIFVHVIVFVTTKTVPDNQSCSLQSVRKIGRM